MEFAKIFTSEKFGQLCAIRATQNKESRPEVRVFCEPSGLGVCSNALIFNDSDEGYDSQEKCFSELTTEMAEAIAKPAFDFSQKLQV